MSSSPLLKGEEDMMLVWPNLSENSKEKKTEDFSVIRSLTGSGSIYRFFILGNKQTGEKRCLESTRGGHNPPGRALVYRAHQGHFLGSFLFS